MDDEKKPFHETVAEKLIEQLKQGTAPWQKPWAPGVAGANMPINPITGKRYKGINALQLMSEGRGDQRWMTYKQAAAVDAQVRKGEKGTPIQYWKFSEDQNKTDAAGKPVFDAHGEPVMETVQLERPRVFFATVFNAEQIDGLPPQQSRPLEAWNAVDRAEHILQASGATIRHGQHDRAFYRSSSDSIHLPDKDQFLAADNYYATALHELGHWTGHGSRLGRDLVQPFGSEGYAKEELRAEIASMIMGDELGIGHDPEQHAAYVGSWIKVLEDDPLEIFRAAADAEKIQEYVMGLEPKLEQELAAYEALDVEILSHAQNRPESVMQRAEAWTLTRIKKDGLARALDGASLAQLNRVEAVLVDMVPLSAGNEFWKRHELPADAGALSGKVDQAKEMVMLRQADAVVASARLDLVTGRTFGQESADDQAKLDDEAKLILGFPLPHDWTGKVRVQGNIKRDIDGDIVVLPAEHRGEKPEFWGIYAQLGDGTYRHLADQPTEPLADQLAERLAVIDARSTISEHEKAAKLARVNEERVRRNPDSTDEDISAAKEARKNAEFAATTNDADLQRRIEFEERQRTQQAGRTEAPQVASKNLITVPYKEKEEAKALGAKWDRNEQSWHVPPNVDPAPFAKWAQQPAAGEAQSAAAIAGRAGVSEALESRAYLAVPYSDRTKAKAAGAKWDKAAKSWYAGPKADLAKLEKWKPENVGAQQGPAMTPREEFAEKLKSISCVIRAGSEHPIMDGEKHCISVEGEKFSEKSGSGFYVGHLDGHPAGYMKNNRTGADLTWKAKGYTLEPEQKALLAAEAAEKLQQREAELSKQQEQAAQRVRKELGKLIPAATATAYMKAKGIAPHAGAFTDMGGKKTYLPATDVHGKQWTTQYIKEDGTKRFAKDSKKEGCFHVVGGMDELVKAPVIVIGEGYATAASLKQSLGFATVSAFDSGNLAAVAQALHQKFPDKQVVIAGDDDRHLEVTQGVNPGRSKAEEAASLVGGRLMMPIFAPGENNYPASLGPVTPDLYREHQSTGTALSDEQLGALAQMKLFTDFNDLANKSVLGPEGIDRQVRSLVGSIIETHQAAISESEQIQHEQDRGAALDPEQVHKVQAEAPKRRKAAKVA